MLNIAKKLAVGSLRKISAERQLPAFEGFEKNELESRQSVNVLKSLSPRKE
jgi:hypothetical protein